MSRCANCWKKGKYNDSAFLYITQLKDHPQALWMPIFLGNNKWAFKADNGKYLTRCQDCVKDGAHSNFAFVHDSNLQDNQTQWELTEVFPKGKINIKS